MGDHDFHIVIGNLITSDSIKSKDFPEPKPEIYKDHACDPSKHHAIPLYNTTAVPGERIELCNVDMLIEVGGKARVIIEIEESDVKPVHIFGKFFASAFSDQYKRDGSVPKPFAPPVLFVQILESSLYKPKSRKPDQWNHIAASIQSLLTSPLHERKWKYQLFQGSLDEFGINSTKGDDLISIIREHLLRKPQEEKPNAAKSAPND